MRTSNNCHL